MHQWLKFIYFEMTLYMFLTVFPSIIRNSRLYRQQQAYVKQTASSQQYLFNKCLLLYLQSWIPFDGRQDRQKHVQCHFKINKFDTSVHLVGFTKELYWKIQCVTHSTRAGSPL